MSRSPNWSSEELLLALNLYMSKDLSWLSKISDQTPEIRTLSYILRNLDIHQHDLPSSFRSVGSIRMKLSNFKALDPKYGKSSLSNIGQSDISIWKQYNSDKNALREACEHIITEHYHGEFSKEVCDYIASFIKPPVRASEEEILVLEKGLQEQLEHYRDLCRLNDEEDIAQACDTLLQVILTHRVKPNEYQEHGGINQERVQDQDKIGRFVRSAFDKLLTEGVLDLNDIENLKSEEWCRQTFHIGHPFIKIIDETTPLKQQLVDENGYLRYWKTIYHYADLSFVLCKEWFESNRKHFEKWLTSINQDNRDDSVFSPILEVLKYIQVADRNNVTISFLEAKSRFPNDYNLDSLFDYLLERGVLAGYQGSLREFIVDDYDMLFDMLHKPGKYFGGANR